MRFGVGVEGPATLRLQRELVCCWRYSQRVALGCIIRGASPRGGGCACATIEEGSRIDKVTDKVTEQRVAQTQTGRFPSATWERGAGNGKADRGRGRRTRTIPERA